MWSDKSFSLSGSLMDKSGCGECQENVACLTALCQLFRGGEIMPRDCFTGVGLGPLVPVKGNLNASTYQDILDNSMLPTLWEQLGEGPLLFKHDCAPVHKARSIKAWLREFCVKELDWPPESHNLNPTEHLWDELEWRL